MMDLCEALEVLSDPELLFRSAREEAVGVLAEAVRDGLNVWWCVAHSSTGPTDPEDRGVCWFFMLAAEALRVHAGSATKHSPCWMVPARLVFEKEQK